jgi:hypothetical protein
LSPPERSTPPARPDNDPAALTVCPLCGRDLHDRPPPNQCPGCGFRYDAHTRVWRSQRAWTLVAIRYVAIGLVLGLVAAGLYRLSQPASPYPVLPLLTAAAGGGLGLFFRWLVGGRIAGRFVAVGPDGIHVGTRPQAKLIPWSQFERVRDQRGILRIQCHDSGTLTPLDDIFDSPADAQSFVTTVQQAARHYGG